MASIIVDTAPALYITVKGFDGAEAPEIGVDGAAALPVITDRTLRAIPISFDTESTPFDIIVSGLKQLRKLCAVDGLTLAFWDNFALSEVDYISE